MQRTISHFILPLSSSASPWSSPSSFCATRAGPKLQIWMQAGDGLDTRTPIVGECAGVGKGPTARYCLYEQSARFGQ